MDSTSLPTFETLRSQHKVATCSDDVRRLFWTLSGPLETSIWIMPNPSSADPTQNLEPYSVHHTVAKMPMTFPPVSSILVDIYSLEQWEDEWLEVHREHCGPGRRFILVNPDSEDDDERYDVDDEGNLGILLACCDTPRPSPSVKLPVRASEKQYVTIHDYVSAVHPWLMGMKNDLLAADNPWDDEPLPESTALMVNTNAPDDLMVEMRDHWIAHHTKGGTGMIVTNISVDGRAYTTSS